ncbi:GGDEF domain-containing protein [Rhizobacter sp. AJA081-3]|uniref:GGDEF domain-containing protein n=1 Tax=Rhizobacter sp. AJA081-3 TaxID=2753607 RepID=UPI001ADFA767|nr:GGDEF domain-containing protein [Rhizobacter sp. AJA081-3]QTN21103.1 GGDEF domain-containing protein [Rhizobacter sp. AJA081-3]
MSRPSAGSSAAPTSNGRHPQPGHANGNGNGNGNGHAGNGHSAPPVAADVANDVAVADWNDMLQAVKERMRQLGDAMRSHDADAPSGVLECATALDQLQETLLHELGRHRRLELELFDTRMALAMSRSALAGTRDGERRARHQALHDDLTSLPNRTNFLARLQESLAPGEASRAPLAVFYLDLDAFKAVNDTHGHAAGDELLRIVAARLARALRAEDLVGRLGGDEFACLIADMPGPAALTQLARKLYDTVAAPLTIGALRFVVRPSIGIAICPDDADTAATLLQCADAAMYRAKRQQLGHAFFEAQADAPARFRAPPGAAAP